MCRAGCASSPTPNLRFRHLFIGCFLLTLPVTAGAATPLFQQVYEMVQKERITTPVATYVAGVFNALYESAFKASGAGKDAIKSDDVKEVLRSGTSEKFCSKVKMGPYNNDCAVLVQQIIKLAQRESGIVRLGHRLQAIATSYEEPITAFSMQPAKLISGFAESLAVWGISGELTESNARSIRMIPTPSDIKKDADAVKKALEKLKDGDNEEAMIAAVWRYQYGLKFVQKYSPLSYPDGVQIDGRGTERQHLLNRPKDLEKKLQTLFESIDKRIGDEEDQISLPRRQEVLYFHIPLDNNISIWAYFRNTDDDTMAETLFPKNIGLQWDMALEPVFPSILSMGNNAPIPGGFYPPAPERKKNTPPKIPGVIAPPPSKGTSWVVLQKGGGGLCYSLSGRMGYLCREPVVTVGEEGHNCEEATPTASTGTIILTSCTPKAAQTWMQSQDVCAEMRKQAGTLFPCAPGSQSLYPFTVLGHACFIKECGQRSYGIKLLPGREPLVSQETTSPWGMCIKPPDPLPPLSYPPRIITVPSFPPYNPAARSHELTLQYCQKTGNPPLSPPSLCQPTLQPALTNPTSQLAIEGLFIQKSADTRTIDEFAGSIEAMGMDVSMTLYGTYLRQVAAALTSALGTTKSLLEQLAGSKFPTLMCPLNPAEPAC
ncbi:MAG: hypothetical protein WCS85_05170 [Candidatus Peribacteraceae bacterium]|jgi:hypothetical protein